jgi:Tfp pilus assembly protein PilO
MNRNITAIILLIIAVAIYFSYTQGVWNDINSPGGVVTQNAAYQSAIASAQKLITLRDQAKSDYANISPADQDRLSKMLPTSVDNIRLIIDLNNLAAQHNLVFKDIKASVADQSNAATAPTQPTVPGAISIAIPKLDTVNVSFGVTATYSQFLSLMEDIESTLRIMDVTGLSVTSSDTGLYSFSVQITTYWVH